MPAGAMPELATAVHVRFQQKYESWPVYGGRVVVHMAQGDPNCSVSSSYLPIPSDQFLKVNLRSEEDAKQIALLALAQHALNGKMEPTEAIGFYLTALDLWLEVGPAGLAGQDWEHTIQGVTTSLGEQLSASDSYVSVHQDVANALSLATQGPQQNRAGLQDVLGRVRGRLRTKTVAWDTGHVVPYASNADADKRFVLPFAGEYYLAYRVEFLSMAGDRGWRVFVNADAADESCHVLGWPESLMAHAFNIYQTSEAAANDQATALAPSAVPVAADLDFVSLKWHEDQGGGVLTIDEVANHPIHPANVIQDAASVAYNAREFYRYFRSLCVNGDLTQMLEDVSRHAPYFDVLVGAAGQPNDNLTTGFVASAAAPAIIFQSAPQLRVGSRLVHHPARDPEVVFHEIAHALMWLMNSEPFDMPVNAVPFGRALVEGYANYFARACAVSRRGDTANVPWARACYRDFDDRYNLAGDSLHSPAGNTLIYPNLYPPAPAADPDAGDALTIELLQKYDIGMIWARVLWRVREQLIASYGPAGGELADKWALNSYFAIPGLIASLEMAAEGILDQAPDALASQLAGLFGARNILAGRGVQALTQASGGEILVGTDRGVRRSSDSGQTWSPAPPNWETFGLGNGVIALAVDSVDSRLYAATERHIYQQGAGANPWLEVGAWPSQQAPLCLSAVGGILYVGTAMGVFFYDTSAGLGGSWARWEAAIPFRDLVFDLAAIRDGNFHIVYAANLHIAQNRFGCLADPNPTDLTWEPVADPAPRGLMGPTTAVALDAARHHAYIGTLAAGVWRQTDLFDPATWQPVISAAQVNGCVLALRVRPSAGGGTELFVATTSGLFKATETAGVWVCVVVPIDGGAVKDVILEVLPVGDDVLVGTANQGLWLGQNISVAAQTWKQFLDIGL